MITTQGAPLTAVSGSERRRWLTSRGAARPRRRSGPQIDRASDEVAANLLRMFRVPAEQARAIAARPLPKPHR